MAKERVQVQGLGDVAPGIQPTIQRAGQYGIQVQKAGTNKLQQLAGALSQINPVLQQYGALQKQQEQIGAEQAALVEEQNVIAELKKQKDVDGFSLLATTNRDRAYRDALLKRHINSTMLPSLTDKAADLLNSKDKAQFNEGLQNLLKSEWDGLVQEVGPDVANSLAGKALWSVVTNPVKNKLALQYEEHRQRVIEQETGDQLNQTLNIATRDKGFDTAILTDIANNYEERLSEDGVDKFRRNELLVDGFAANLKLLLAQDRASDAKSMYDAMRAIQLKGKVKVFGTKEAAKQLTPILSDINRELSRVTTDSTAEKRRILGGKIYSVISASNITEKDDMPDAKLNTMRSAISTIMPKLKKEEVEAYIDRAFAESTRPGDLGQNFLNILDELGSTSDTAAALYFPIAQGALKDYEEVSAVGASIKPANIADPEVREEELEKFRMYVRDNPDEEVPWKGWIASQGGRVEKFEELLEESERLTAGNYVQKKDYFQNVPMILRAQLKSKAKSLEAQELNISQTADLYSPESISYVLSELKDKAIELKDLEPVERDKQLKAFSIELMDEESRRYEGIAKASSIIISRDPEPAYTAEQARKMEVEGIRYASLEKDRVTNRAEINRNRKRMVEYNHTSSLALSLARHGFDRFDPQSADMLSLTGMDGADVKLFYSNSELNRYLLEWDGIIEKDLAREEELTEEEKEIRAIYQKLGIFNKETLEIFANAQRVFY
jgi:hypothetical protein